MCCHCCRTSDVGRQLLTATVAIMACHGMTGCYTCHVTLGRHPELMRHSVWLRTRCSYCFACSALRQQTSHTINPATNTCIPKNIHPLFQTPEPYNLPRLLNTHLEPPITLSLGCPSDRNLVSPAITSASKPLPASPCHSQAAPRPAKAPHPCAPASAAAVAGVSGAVLCLPLKYTVCRVLRKLSWP
jgi:hypothetical protein